MAAELMTGGVIASSDVFYRCIIHYKGRLPLRIGMTTSSAPVVIAGASLLLWVSWVGVLTSGIGQAAGIIKQGSEGM
jgi:hypothetical protein